MTSEPGQPASGAGAGRPVVVTDVAVVTALGDTLAATWQALLGGQTGIRPLARFPTDRYAARVAACVDRLPVPVGGGSRLWPLLERLLAGLGPLPADTRLFAATTKGAIDALENWRLGRPFDPADLEPGRVLDWLRSRLGLCDDGLNVNAACASSTVAVSLAAAEIAAGRAEVAVVCAADLVSEFVFSGFSALQALSPVPCRPFDRARAGLSLGEGAAALVLMGAGRARHDGRPPIATVAGWGVADDATHVTAPARDGCGLIQATQLALARAGLGPADIAAISAHGTGTVYNDLMELTAFRRVFGGVVPPMHSVKGALGHTLGAAGAIETALGLVALREQTAPPTVGLREPEAGAEGLVSSRPQRFSGRYLLTSNSGFGGINAAVVLGPPPGPTVEAR